MRVTCPVCCWSAVHSNWKGKTDSNYFLELKVVFITLTLTLTSYVSE